MLTTRPLDPSTWDAFADLVERDGGVWGGCWCMGFHPKREDRFPDNRTEKHCRVLEGRTRSALVFEGDACVGWCQFGRPEELPRIKYGKAYRSENPPDPDWRITCFYVGKGHRKKGVANTALLGALQQIAELGGGVVESMPEDTTDRKVSGSFLFNGTLAMFECAGFQRIRPLGKNAWLVSKHIAKATS